MSLKNERADIILDILKAGGKPYEALEAANKATKRFSIERGNNTYYRFVDNSRRFFAWMLRDIQKANGRDDHKRGIDCFLCFNDDPGSGTLALSTLPVQIKSSDEDVSLFREDPRYLQLGKRIMVINSSMFVSNNVFKENFFHEINRINNLTH